MRADVQAGIDSLLGAVRRLSEPASARLFRTSLLKCECVAQLFDPWFMDQNTRDETPPEPNMQRGAATSNERLHAHYLHVIRARAEDSLTVRVDVIRTLTLAVALAAGWWSAFAQTPSSSSEPAKPAERSGTHVWIERPWDTRYFAGPAEPSQAS